LKKILILFLLGVLVFLPVQSAQAGKTPLWYVTDSSDEYSSLPQGYLTCYRQPPFFTSSKVTLHLDRYVNGGHTELQKVYAGVYVAPYGGITYFDKHPPQFGGYQSSRNIGSGILVAFQVRMPVDTKQRNVLTTDKGYNPIKGRLYPGQISLDVPAVNCEGILYDRVPVTVKNPVQKMEAPVEAPEPPISVPVP
jgi:hypothetical protein